MSSCIEGHFSNMLYAFELDLLDEQQGREMEIHLYECEHCFGRVKSFGGAAWLLGHDADVHAFLQKEAEAESESSREIDGDVEHIRVDRKRSLLVRYLLAAVLVLAVGIPIYRIGITPDVQRLELTPVRGGSVPTLSVEAGGAAEIRFSIEPIRAGGVFQLSVYALEGDTVYADPTFTDISGDGTGRVELRLDSFDPGYYMLTVADATSQYLDVPVQYLFQVQ